MSGRYYIAMPPVTVYKQAVVDGEAKLLAHNVIGGGEYANAEEAQLLGVEEAYMVAVQLLTGKVLPPQPSD